MFSRGFASVLFASLAAVACNGGPEGLVRWSAQACPPSDGAVTDGGDASAPQCEPAAHRASNTALPTPKPDRSVFQCSARIVGEGAARTFEVGFSARDPRGGSLAVSFPIVATPAPLGGTSSFCTVTLSEAGRSSSGQCGRECTLTITGYAESTRTISGRLVCARMPEQGAVAEWFVRNAEGVPGMAADFSLANCDPPLSEER